MSVKFDSDFKSCCSYLMVSLKINLVCILALNPNLTWNNIAVLKSGLRKLPCFRNFLEHPRTTKMSTSCWGLTKVLEYFIHTDPINYPDKPILQVKKLEVVSSAEVSDSFYFFYPKWNPFFKWKKYSAKRQCKNWKSTIVAMWPICNWARNCEICNWKIWDYRRRLVLSRLWKIMENGGNSLTVQATWKSKINLYRAKNISWSPILLWPIDTF